MRRLLSRLILPLLGMSLLFAPATALAWSPYSNVDCSGDAANSAVCSTSKTEGNPISGPDGILLKVVTIIAFFAGATAVIVIVIGGLRFVFANGDSNSIAAARKTVIYALLGLFIIAISRQIIAFILSKV